MKALVIGCGSIGKRHLHNLKALAAGELLAFDPRPDRREEAAAQSSARGVASLEQGLALKPDLAIVATPNSLHLAPALAAARAGCHLFIEKPLSHNLEGLDELAREVSSRRLTALVGCNMRFHPGVAALKRLLAEGAIGRLLCARVIAGSYLPDWHPWEDYRKGYSARADLGGGVILDGIHEIDYMLDLLGDVSEVSCVAGRLSSLEIDTEDAAEIVLRAASGALANIHLDYLQRAYRRSCLLTGSEGTLEWDFSRPEVRLYRSSSKAWEDVALSADASDVNAMYVAEMRHLLACVAGHEQPLQDIATARRALEVACAAKESSRSGSRIVLPERLGAPR